MSESFKSVFTSARGSDQKLSVGMTSDGYLNLVVRDRDGRVMGGVALVLQDAPAVMLAVAQSSGINPTAHESYASADHDRTLEDAAWEIRRVVNARERESEAAVKEAADREALEGEAWELYKARTNGSIFPTFGGLREGTQREWIAVAKHARTMHKASK